MSTYRPLNRYIAEIIGTYGLVFAGCGAIVIDSVAPGMIGHLGVCVTFGIIVMGIVYAFGDVSGAHINPAVTIAFWAAGRFEGKHVAPYIAAQILGAILSSLTLYVMFPETKVTGMTLPLHGWLQSLVLEIIITFFLMTVILYVSQGSKEKGMFAGIAVGGMVFMLALLAGPISGASMNPARSIAPALVALNFGDLWIYLVAPIIGSLLAVLLWKGMDRK